MALTFILQTSHKTKTQHHKKQLKSTLIREKNTLQLQHTHKDIMKLTAIITTLLYASTKSYVMADDHGKSSFGNSFDPNKLSLVQCECQVRDTLS